MRQYQLQAHGISRTINQDLCDFITLSIPDDVSPSDVDRALDRLKKDIRGLERNG